MSPTSIHLSTGCRVINYCFNSACNRELRYLRDACDTGLIVLADDTEAVIADLNTALDQLEQRHTIFGGGVETAVSTTGEHGKRSALAHTRAAG
jgi:di/tripeptidase